MRAAILVVDASQGIEAQTLANTYLAVDSGLEIVPVVNKIDLPSADPDRVIQEIEDVIGIPAEDAPKISAKAGINIHAVLEKVVHDIPAPTGDINAPLRALIFDSYYDSYKGVIIYVRLKEGQIHPGDEFKLMQRAVCSMLLSADLCTQPLPKRPTVFMQARLATSRVQSRLLQTQRSATRLHSHQIPQKNRSPATVRHSLWFSAVLPC